MQQEYDKDESYFRLLSDWYVSGRYQIRLDPLLAIVKKYVNEETRVLDAGCGSGAVAIELARQGVRRVDAVDFSVTALKCARRDASRFDVADKINFILSPVENIIDVSDNTYDLIIAADVIEHLADHDLFSKEMLRVCKPGGILVVETPNTSYRTHPLSLKLRKIFEKIGFSDGKILLPVDKAYFRFHINMLTWEGLLELLHRTGWQIVAEKPFGWWYQPGIADRVMSLYVSLGSIFNRRLRFYRSTDVVVVCRKDKDNGRRANCDRKE